MKLWSTEDVLKYSSVIVHAKMSGQPVQVDAPDAHFQKKHQTSMLTEVKRGFPDLEDEAAMAVYREAREARYRSEIAEMLVKNQSIAEKYWAFWPNTLWFGYALRVYGRDTHPQADAVYREAEKAIRAQLSGELPLDLVPTVSPVKQEHLEEILSMILHNHAELYRIQNDFDRALQCLDESIEVTVNPEALTRRFLAKAGILAQKGDYEQAKAYVQRARQTHSQEWEHQLELFVKDYPGLNRAIQEVN